MKTIKQIEQQDRPREKMLAKGVAALSNEELLQVIIGSGGKGNDVVKISKNLHKLLKDGKGKVRLEDVLKITGIAEANGTKIVAALEIGNRFNLRDSEILDEPEKIVDLLSDIRDKKQEHFVSLTLDGANRLIEKRIVTIGTLTASLVHPREVFADAITDRAASIVVAHNHPSGDLEVSPDDLEITKRLKESGELLGIHLLDHIIVTKTGWKSII
ncbi:MAG: DNA repair protein RadC [Prevotellaceae bacterium]|jgi:DNA repair protein RadC|nr:DNA repair protein RadC [Prevotellaceae bacterium]